MSIVENKKAYHDYFVEEKFEAGLALEGWEVKAIRAGRAQLKEAYVVVKNGEIVLLGAHITPLADRIDAHPARPTRTRKLLLHRSEINRLVGKVERAGYTLTPLNLHFSKGASSSRSALRAARSNTTSARPRSSATGTAKSSGCCAIVPAAARDACRCAHRAPMRRSLFALPPSDLAAITAIYAHHVRNGTASFELDRTRPRGDAPTLARASSSAGCPIFVARLSATDRHRRGIRLCESVSPAAGYRFTVEDSVYVAPQCAGRGIGRGLAAACHRCLRSRSATGRCWRSSAAADNAASIALHARAGVRATSDCLRRSDGNLTAGSIRY